MPHPMGNKNVWQSFARAFEGLSHVLWTQRTIRMQLFFTMMVMLLAYVMHLPRASVMFMLSAVAAVLMAEMFNTAIEVVVNMITESYHPLAKIAKDVGAGGVLIASIYASLIGVAIFFDRDRVTALLSGIPNTAQLTQPHALIVIFLGIAVVSIIVILSKIRVGHGSILRGGAVSGHSAVAFLLAAAIYVYSGRNPLISILGLCLAILVAQSRVEGKIHTMAEVLWGAMVAIALMALLMLLAPGS
ncbi:MAG: diacylglycerol kinase [Armatimonadota bacterium]